MNWLKNFVKPKLKALVQKDIPDDLWHSCKSCHTMIFHKDLKKSLFVCTQCGEHMRMKVKDRLEMLFDNGEYQTIKLPETKQDPLKFKDQKKYTDRLKDAKTKTNQDEALIVAHGLIGNISVVIAALNFDFMGGSMSVAVGEGIIAASQLAIMQQAAFVVIPSSGGARMQEGVLSLMQMPRSVIAVEKVKEAGLPYIVVLVDPTAGGVTASFAMLGDIHIAEKGAMICFAGARVIEQTIRQKLPEGFQKAEFLKKHGVVDIVVERKELRSKLKTVIDLLMRKQDPAKIIPIDGYKQT